MSRFAMPFPVALGIPRVRSVNPLQLQEMKEALDWAFAVTDAPSVIITKWPCVLKKFTPEETRQYKVRRVPCRVDRDTCIGCKTCLRTGCPALRYETDSRKAHISQADCVGCTVCLQVCPVQAIAAEEGA